MKCLCFFQILVETLRIRRNGATRSGDSHVFHSRVCKRIKNVDQKSLNGGHLSGKCGLTAKHFYSLLFIGMCECLLPSSSPPTEKGGDLKRSNWKTRPLSTGDCWLQPDPFLDHSTAKGLNVATYEDRIQRESNLSFQIWVGLLKIQVDFMKGS